MIYDRITRHMDDDQVLRVDALLGDARAEAELQRRRRSSVADHDFEVG